MANAILLSDDWEPGKLFAPNQHLVPEHGLLEPDIPFAAGAELIVDILVDPRGSYNVYIDVTTEAAQQQHQ